MPIKEDIKKKKKKFFLYGKSLTLGKYPGTVKSLWANARGTIVYTSVMVY